MVELFDEVKSSFSQINKKYISVRERIVYDDGEFKKLTTMGAASPSDRFDFDWAVVETLIEFREAVEIISSRLGLSELDVKSKIVKMIGGMPNKKT